MSWYSFTGSNPANANDYTLVSGTPSCSTPTQRLCAIQANDDGSNHPDLDNAILSEMVQALDSQNNTANVRLKAR
ncbi:hypothetical protein ABTW24_22800 [Sphingobacterium thalpophilum]|uniref:Uncharacterized protein n=3 Tax=Sphingobacteriaceae TaxID=84566 RepID=A0ACC6KV89_9SPHI|nr:MULTISPECIES: hypothetical protein [Sphingobacteriaceae]MDR6783283.1 hypothetical protein [Pedobacter africanus]QMV67162.1 hypothetical protein HS960_05615 [Sphingobacterium paramultivorum]WSO16014.1 hypothetical protein VUL84_05595 [Sphingobacterium paramultivorum]